MKALTSDSIRRHWIMLLAIAKGWLTPSAECRGGAFAFPRMGTEGAIFLF
ncbi:hypothetical protein [Paenibacillus residui]|uniref:Uncharacterized protein n=1 Tax=Paenibacillus residui TaxID=629724 RepID=A0ABW3DGX5_9BACL